MNHFTCFVTICYTKKIISFQKPLENDKFITNLLVFPLLGHYTTLFKSVYVSENNTKLVKCKNV